MSPSPLREEQLPDGALRISSERGTIYFMMLRPGVMWVRQEGVLDADFAAPMLREFDRALALHGELKLYGDGTALKSTESSYRELLVPWFKAHKHQLHIVAVVRSKLIEMALSLLSMFVGGLDLKMYSPALFEAEIRRELPGVKLPLPPTHV